MRKMLIVLSFVASGALPTAAHASGDAEELQLAEEVDFVRLVSLASNTEYVQVDGELCEAKSGQRVGEFSDSIVFLDESEREGLPEGYAVKGSTLEAAVPSEYGMTLEDGTYCERLVITVLLDSRTWSHTMRRERCFQVVDMQRVSLSNDEVSRLLITRDQQLDKNGQPQVVLAGTGRQYLEASIGSRGEAVLIDGGGLVPTQGESK